MAEGGRQDVNNRPREGVSRGACLVCPGYLAVLRAVWITAT